MAMATATATGTGTRIGRRSRRSRAAEVVPAATRKRSRGVRNTSALGLLLLTAGVVRAQAAGPQGIVVQPSLFVQQTLTSNVDLTTDGHSDAITQISPGIRVAARTARASGFLLYSLDAIHYLHD